MSQDHERRGGRIVAALAVGSLALIGVLLLSTPADVAAAAEPASPGRGGPVPALLCRVFRICPSTTTTSTSTTTTRDAPGGTGIEGTLTMLRCPLVSRVACQPLPPPPSSRVIVSGSPAGVSATVDATGAFALALPPGGPYQVRGQLAGRPDATCRPVDVVVPATEPPAPVKVHCTITYWG
jgi:hypothetical protein